MKIGGLIKCSLIDYPGKIAAVIFTQGCNFWCPYCHNPQLVDPRRFQALVPESVVLDFLKKRFGQLNGVVVTGGEPTFQDDLIPFLKTVKEIGYSVKLDTNGSHPEVLREVLEEKLADYVAMDLKAALEKYDQLTSIQDCQPRVQESIRLILGAGIPYEFRTTVIKSLIPPEDFEKLHALIQGAKNYRLQRFNPRGKLLEPGWADLKGADYSDEEFSFLQQRWSM